MVTNHLKTSVFCDSFMSEVNSVLCSIFIYATQNIQPLIMCRRGFKIPDPILKSLAIFCKAVSLFMKLELQSIGLVKQISGS